MGIKWEAAEAGMRKCKTILEYHGMFAVAMMFILLAGGHLGGGQSVKLILAQIFFILVPGLSILRQADFAYRNKVIFGLCAWIFGEHFGIYCVSFAWHTAVFSHRICCLCGCMYRPARKNKS